MRCKPERAPCATENHLQRQIIAAIEQGISTHLSVPEIAALVGLSDRQFRRHAADMFGATPIALLQCKRLQIAEQLLDTPGISVTDVAFAAGFDSIRRFNTAYLNLHGRAPSVNRKVCKSKVEQASIVLHLSYRPPFAYDELLSFLRARCVDGVELITSDAYFRRIEYANVSGVLEVRNQPASCELRLRVPPALFPFAPDICTRVRRLFDLDADPSAIASRLGNLASDNPGLRVPGAYDGFEMAVRAICGQHITVASATKLAGRIARKFGSFNDPETLLPCGTFPTASQLARASEEDLILCGTVRTRARAILHISAAVDSGKLSLSPFADPHGTMRSLIEIPGIGDWTAQYIAMRALAWPDAFPAGDLILRKALNVRTAAQCENAVANWRPWRSYAAIHLWHSQQELK